MTASRCSAKISRIPERQLPTTVVMRDIRSPKMPDMELRCSATIRRIRERQFPTMVVMRDIRSPKMPDMELRCSATIRRIRERQLPTRAATRYIRSPKMPDMERFRQRSGARRALGPCRVLPQLFTVAQQKCVRGAPDPCPSANTEPVG